MELIPRPSGKRLPLFLLKKWRAQQNMAKDESSSSDHQQPDQPSRLTRTEASTLSNRVFAAEELEDRLYKTSVVITDMQKQIQRGEEIYYEETFNHGNLFRGGWDTFVDAKDAGAGDTGFTRTTNQGSSRTVPNDAKWFSNSCTPKQRRYRPAPSVRTGTTPTSTSDMAHVASNSNVATVASRSDTNIPTAVVDPKKETSATVTTGKASDDKPQAQAEDTRMTDAGNRKRKEPEVNESDGQPAQKKPNTTKLDADKSEQDDLKQNDSSEKNTSGSADPDQDKNITAEKGTNSNNDQADGSGNPGGSDGSKKNEPKKEDIQIRRTTRNRRSSN